MDHLVREHPIARQIGELRAFADVNGDEAAVVASKSAAAAHTFSVGRHDAEQELRNGEAAVIRADGFRGPAHPLHQIFFTSLHRAGLDVDVNARVADDDGGGHFVSRKSGRCSEPHDGYGEDRGAENPGKPRASPNSNWLHPATVHTPWCDSSGIKPRTNLRRRAALFARGVPADDPAKSCRRQKSGSAGPRKGK